MRKISIIIALLIIFFLLVGEVLAQPEFYREIRIAFSAFDLFAGLTGSDLETLRGNSSFCFVYLILCIWLIKLMWKPKRQS